MQSFRLSGKVKVVFNAGDALTGTVQTNDDTFLHLQADKIGGVIIPWVSVKYVGLISERKRSETELPEENSEAAPKTEPALRGDGRSSLHGLIGIT